MTGAGWRRGPDDRSVAGSQGASRRRASRNRHGADAANDNQPACERPVAVLLRWLNSQDDETGYDVVIVADDPAHDRIVFSARSDEEVIAIWRKLGAEWLLPLWVSANGAAPVRVTWLPGETTCARRRGSAMGRRRPRFLACRRVGAQMGTGFGRMAQSSKF